MNGQSPAKDGLAGEAALRCDAMSAYKPDWREAKERMIDWWSGRKTDRVPARVTAPRAGAPPRAAHGTVVERLLDLPTIFANLDDELANTFHGGEAFPNHFVYIGAVIMGAFLGCEPEFRPESTWQRRLPFSWDEADRVRFDPSNQWWRTWCDLHRAAAERARGRYLVSAGGGGAVADVMVNMFGHEEALLAMAERPADVRRLRDRMLRWGDRMSGEVFGIVAPRQEGHIDWLRIWAPGTLSSIQCDVSLMLSREMFDDLFLDELRHECRRLDYSIYHLDGSGALHHLDSLLSIEELDMIQWNPEPAVPSDPLAFAPQLRKMLRAGKKLYLSCRPDRVRAVLEGLGGEGVFLSISCKTEAEARQVLRELDRIGT